MKRYYYTDELAAAWMHKHHRMRFQVLAPGGDGVAFYDYVPFQLSLWNQQPQMYVHPESVHLLEPQAGDFVQFGIDNYGVFREPEPQYRRNFSGIPILLRNGKPFMRPEEEA